MRNGRCALLACVALLAARADVGVAQSAHGPGAGETVWRARVAFRFDPASRCPDVRLASDDDEVVAVVLFRVGSTGVPSQASISSPSGSAGLDAAAVNCVLKLRFQPATRLGDGTAIDSWQQIGWKWTARAARQNEPVTTAAHEPTAMAAAVLPSSAGQESRTAAQAPAPAQPVRAAEVRACADPSGRLAQAPLLLHSSGDPQLDEAALKIAATGAASYRPATTSAGKSLSGCVQLTIKFD